MTCRYCGQEQIKSHHCSGKLAYEKGFADGVASVKIPKEEETI